ncbi:PhoX family protein [Acidihalobacter ferrooxydans]|uniref:Alkaline phosphatase n=1 Tax=Acidihalobacter ferrooxydans TaxID=1765967 RepID=A0A1P8UDE2_9GAMM|nr:alkaline phosphatase PhoX [Acidihalobacter ferrooxydans]APZ41881.1 hypothetical protein BW247_01180 [Acidihalobacter ferrooxydans]
MKNPERVEASPDHEAESVSSRRRFLGLLGGAPFLLSGPSVLTGASLLGMSGSSRASTPATASPATPIAIKFNSMPAPSSVAERATVFTNATIDVIYANNSTKTLSLSYKTLYKTGDTLTTPTGAPVLAGGYFNVYGNPIIDTSGATPKQFFSDCPDGQSLIKLHNSNVPGISGNILFLVTQFEYKSENQAGNPMYGKLPSPVAIATLDQDKNSGEMTVKSYFNVPTDSVHGLWITCAASLSPWNTHLGSEEYPPDAWYIEQHGNDKKGLFRDFSKNTFGAPNVAKPYHYGHVPEVTVNPDGTGSIKKYYCMGRISREKVKILPDNRTVLQGDDTTAGGIFVFVADVPGYLSSGTLYAAKLTAGTVPSGSAPSAGAFDIAWIRLGHATSGEIEYMADTLKASGIIDVQYTDPSDSGYTLINYGGSETEWVKIKPGMEKAAAFLETARYAAVLGATMELTKFEGVTLDETNGMAYFAMSSIKKTMSDHAGAIQLNKNKAGAIYALPLGSAFDTNGRAINSAWVPLSMSAPSALVGEPMASDANGNTANVDKIANPDNLSFSKSMGTLFIGEDSGMHLNNAVWAYNVSDKSLARILTVPAGAECTGLQVKDNMNGFAYVMSNFQHPGDWSFASPSQDSLKAAVQENWGDLKNAQAAVGYISGIPSLS